MAQAKSQRTPLEEFLDKAKKQLKRCIDADNHNRLEALEDLKFLNGDQWENAEKQRRKLRNRPVLQVNLLPKYVDQIVGEERHNRPKIKMRPVDSKADVHIAAIREGIINSITYNSNAEAIYDQACEMQVSCGYGAWRILTRYCEDNPFVQEIYLEAIRNPFMVYMDPDVKDAVFADAKYGFVIEKLTRDEFETRWPDAELPGDPLKTGIGLSQEHWYDENLVTVAEYFIRSTRKEIVCQMADGQVCTEDIAQEKIQEWEAVTQASQPPIPPMPPPIPPQGMAPPGPPSPMGASPSNPMAPPGMPPTPPMNPTVQPPQGMPPMGAAGPMALPPVAGPPSRPKPEIIKKRETERAIIKHYIITAIEILSENGLEGEIFPGEFVPIVCVVGKERNIEGKRFVRGLVRDARDTQKMINYWNTAAAETIALAPKAPWVGTAKQFEGYENDYASANVENFPFLKYNQDGSAPPPSRTHPGDPPVAIFAQIQRGEENLKSVIGMFNADVGDKGAVQSGVGITKLQTPGDVGTFVFLDNLARSIQHCGRIINSMIPTIYDTERDARLKHFDDTETYVPINTSAQAALGQIQQNPEKYKGMDIQRLQKSIAIYGSHAKFNDITVGKYDVVVSVGPSYATARAEAADALIKLASTNPKISAMAMDLIVENLDFKDADKLAARFRRALPPAIAPMREGEPPRPPQPPPPQVIIAQGKMQVAMAQIEVQKARLEVEKIKAIKEAADAKGEVKRMIIQVLKELNAPEHPADALGNMGFTPNMSTETPQ